MLPSFSKIRSSMILAAFALSTSIVAGCKVQTDDVYTADETNVDIAPIARDEVRFPLPQGTRVPNADGVAVELQPTMRGIRLEFEDFIVDRACEPDSSSDNATDRGEFYFQIDLNNRPIVRRPSESSYSAAAGSRIPVSARRVFFINAGEEFVVRFGVSENDDLFTGADDFVGNRSIVLSDNGLANGPVTHLLRIGDSDCQVHAQFVVSRVQ
jgi:hypothetical protein